MRTSEEIESDIYRCIMATDFPNQISGVVKIKPRPMGSRSEDCIVSVLANPYAQKQVATVNVNIYVQDNIAERQTEKASIRIKELKRLFYNKFKEIHGDDYDAHILSQDTFSADGADEHVINNKIEYKHINE